MRTQDFPEEGATEGEPITWLSLPEKWRKSDHEGTGGLRSKCLLRNYGKPYMLIPAFTSIVQSQSLSHHMNRALVNIPYPTQWSLCTCACVLSRSRNLFWLAAQSVEDVLVVVVDEAFRRTDQQRTRLHSHMKIFCDCDSFLFVYSHLGFIIILFYGMNSNCKCKNGCSTYSWT